MIAVRTILLALVAALFSMTAFADERIDRFNVTIDVQKDGDIIVTELIAVTAELTPAAPGCWSVWFLTTVPSRVSLTVWMNRGIAPVFLIVSG